MLDITSRSSNYLPACHGRLDGLENIPKSCGSEPDSTRREQLEQYISSIFQAAYGARVLEYLPLLFSLEQGDVTTAALGLRSAATTPLFCEQYLQVPVEQSVLSLYDQHVSRSKVMELGNLVSSTAGSGVMLYLLTAAALNEAGIRYLLFAANKAVRTSIRRTGFTPKSVCPARPDSLGAQSENWGSYYDGEPLVMLADIPLTLRQARAQPTLCRYLEDNADHISTLAESIESELP
jgi:hypothetical protein